MKRMKILLEWIEGKREESRQGKITILLLLPYIYVYHPLKLLQRFKTKQESLRQNRKISTKKSNLITPSFLRKLHVPKKKKEKKKYV